MSDRYPNDELNDELLSAYIDGELTADERAAVEARLDSDPAARQLLHQLRSVSESVQAIPQEKPEHDLSDSILERISAMRASSGAALSAGPVVSESPSAVRGSPDPAHAPDPRSPGLELGKAIANARFFHSKRAWIWTSLALAAGVLIMIVQRGDESAKKLPPVAQRDQPNLADEPAHESLERSRREVTALPPSATPMPSAVASTPPVETPTAGANTRAPASGTAMPAAPSPKASQLTNAAKPAGPEDAASSGSRRSNVSKLDDVATRSDSAAAADGKETNTLAKSPQPTGRASESNPALGSVAAEDRSKSVSANRNYMVVHVVATADALKRNAFDELLQQNGITLQSQPARANSSAAAGADRYARQLQPESAVKDLERKQADAPARDFILVQGDRPKIDALIADLKQKSNEYVSVDVNAGSSARERIAQSLSTSDKTVSDRFSGVTAGQTGSGGRGAKKDYFDFNQGLQQRAGESSVSGGPSELQKQSPTRQPAQERFDIAAQNQKSNEAWAVRIERSQAKERELELDENRSAGRLFGSVNEPTQSKPAFKKKLEEKAQQITPDENVKVLFVLSPQQPAAAASPTTSPTTEQK